MTQGTDLTRINGDSTSVERRQQALGPSFSSAIIQTHYAVDAMALLEDFGFSYFTEAFKKSGGVRQVWNMLSLESNLHLNFDELDLWFERTSRVCHLEIRQSR